MQNSAPYHAIADANRRKILDLLRSHGSLRAGEIVTQLPHISQPAVSKHLRILREAKLVCTVADGRERAYSLNPETLRQMVEWLRHYEPLWDSRLDTLKQLIEQDEQTQGERP